MKKYKEYMDGVTASDTLHEKLKSLEVPKKKPQAWKKYGALAAALVLVIGLGALGLTGDRDAIFDSTIELGESGPEISEPALEIITTEPAPVPMPNSSGMETMGGYEVVDGEIVAYYMLPYIEYGEVKNEMAADIALPIGVTRRDLTDDELLALLGGEAARDIHLDWGSYELSAHAMIWPDDSLWLLCISGSKGDTGLEHFCLEVSPDQLPPSCLYYSRSTLNDIWGRDVWAESYDGEFASSRRVSFMDRDYGYRFAITGADTEAITERVSRLVRWVIAGDGLTFEKEEPAVNSEETTTMPYDPAASATPEME